MNASSGSELLCPRCKVPLQEVRTSGGVFWACNVCGGRAVTIELLRNRFTPESINPLWLHAMRGEGHSGALCPLCRHPMIDVALSDRAEINVGVCQHCHFLWFDAHEIDTLVPRVPQKPAAKLPQKVREMLAIAEVQMLAEEAEGTDFDSAHPMNRGNKSPPFLEYRLNSIPCCTLGAHGPHGCSARWSSAQAYSPSRGSTKWSASSG